MFINSLLLQEIKQAIAVIITGFLYKGNKQLGPKESSSRRRVASLCRGMLGDAAPWKWTVALAY